MKIESQLIKLIHEEIKFILGEGKSYDYNNLIHNWIESKQKEYIKFLNKLFIGKSIRAKASKWSDRGHTWTQHDIMNIKKLKADGGKFYTEVPVQDENGQWYTLLGEQGELI